MLRIGDFARLANVSIKLLRRYDAAGLLPAQAIDRATGYRYYSVTQLARLNRLLVYRSLGFSFKEIRRLVRAEASPSELRDMLTDRRAVLAARLEADRARLAELEARVAEIERNGHAPRYEVSIRTLQAATAVSLRQRCASYDDVDDLLREIRSRLPRRVSIDGYGAIWRRCSATSGEIDCEALVFLDYKKASRPSGTLVQLPSCTVASVVHEEGDADARLAYRAAIERATTLGYRIAGPMRERYLGYSPGGASVTEVQFPVEFASAATAAPSAEDARASESSRRLSLQPSRQTHKPVR